MEISILWVILALFFGIEQNNLQIAFGNLKGIAELDKIIQRH